MPSAYKIYNVKDFIRKTPTGGLDLDRSMSLVRELATASSFHTGHNLLVDLSKTVAMRTSFEEVLSVAVEFAKYQGVFRNRIAVVIPDEPERHARLRFFKEALGPVSFELDYFTEYEEAIEWLSEVTDFPQS